MTTLLHPARCFVAATLALVAIAAALLGVPDAQATSPGTNGAIFFGRRVGNEDHLYVVNPDGSDERELSTSFSYGVVPSIFANGSKIAYTDINGAEVFNVDGSGTDGLPSVRVGTRLSAAPDGSAFAYQTNENGYAKIGMEGPDGSGQHVLFSANGLEEWWARWSPDNQRIAFLREAQPWQLWTSGPDGTDQQFVVEGIDPHVGAGWSPDGLKLIYTDNEWALYPSVGATHLVVVNADGSDKHEIVLSLPEGSAAHEPRFSPDGRQIVFSVSGATTGIFIANVDGSDVHRVTSGSDSSPAWQAIPVPPSTTTTSTSTSTTTTSTTTSTSTTTTTTTIPNVAPKPIITIGHVKDTLTMKVNGSRSTDSDGAVESYKWQWGDNTPAATTSAASHTYAKAGDYLVRLTVTDNQGARATAALWVRAATRAQSVQNTFVAPPKTVPKSGANTSPVPVMGIAWANFPMQLQTSGSRSYDPDGHVTAYAWDFGDGYTTNANPASRIYDAPGRRRVTLTVTDDDGAQSSTEVWVNLA